LYRWLVVTTAWLPPVLEQKKPIQISGPAPVQRLILQRQVQGA
jgi:hypothetical protein